MRRSVVTLTIVVGLVFVGVFGLEQQRSSAQDPTLRKKPACTIYCCDGCADTITLAQPPACWGGPLSATGAGDSFRNLSPEDQTAVCRNLTNPANNNNPECPVFKTIFALCKEREKVPPTNESKKPPCKERKGPPWFDPSAEGCQDLRETKYETLWTNQNGGTCTVKLLACNYVILTRSISSAKVENGELVISGYGSGPERRWGFRPVKESECNAALALKVEQGLPEPRRVCCELWREAARSGGPCNPERDANCDGVPNSISSEFYRPLNTIDNRSPYYAPGGSDSESLFNPVNPDDFNMPDFDPRPPGLEWDEIMPNEPCKNCKWVATSGKLTCSPDGRRDHEYKATWVCPSSGVTRTVTKRAPASAPCTPPSRAGQ